MRRERSRSCAIRFWWIAQHRPRRRSSAAWRAAGRACGRPRPRWNSPPAPRRTAPRRSRRWRNTSSIEAHGARRDRAAEMLAHRLLAEGALRPEVGDARSSCSSARQADMISRNTRATRLGRQRARGCAARDAAQHLRLALGAVGRRRRPSARRSRCASARAALQQREQLVVERVDLARAACSMSSLMPVSSCARRAGSAPPARPRCARVRVDRRRGHRAVHVDQRVGHLALATCSACCGC